MDDRWGTWRSWGALAVAILALIVASYSLWTSSQMRQGVRAQSERSSSAGNSAPATKAGDEPDLAATLLFEDPASCEHGKKLTAILESMRSYPPTSRRTVSAKPVFIRELGASIVPIVRRSPHPDGSVTFESTLPLRGTFYGLRLKELVARGTEHSDANVSDEIRFLEPPDDVSTVLAEQGFEPPPLGESSKIPWGDSKQLREIKGGTAFVCAW